MKCFIQDVYFVHLMNSFQLGGCLWYCLHHLCFHCVFGPFDSLTECFWSPLNIVILEPSVTDIHGCQSSASSSSPSPLGPLKGGPQTDEVVLCCWSQDNTDQCVSGVAELLHASDVWRFNTLPSHFHDSSLPVLHLCLTTPFSHCWWSNIVHSRPHRQKYEHKCTKLIS